ncbi:hypothetical protein [Cellulomonas dongxiuzhuiae]|uniref:hypothetical protein n=1 Tax=Cellulomonas dongxiuzhuiae TaxID=2819979 RepID=UPI001AAEEC8B|nr:hypothetical protein [Cellulomonas dongxiuzhuiae]MBO3089485.1 hypothetical protein [Cellulomonas dongxiuzhuiae]
MGFATGVRNGLATALDREALREAGLALKALEGLEMATRLGRAPSEVREQITVLSVEIQTLQFTPRKQRTAELRHRVSDLKAQKARLVAELVAETSDPGGPIGKQRHTATRVRSVVRGGSPGLGKSR